jgi:uncharacterized protein (DUF302 family)
MTAATAPVQGLVSVRSTLSFEKTAECLLIAFKRRGMAIYACVDHAANARAAGLELRPSQLFIFGYPEAEGPVIARCPALGLELPRKMLVYEDRDGLVWIGYHDPVWLGQRHGVGADVLTLLRPMATSFKGIALEAGGMSPLVRPAE